MFSIGCILQKDNRGLLCTYRMVHLNTIMAVKLEVDSYSAALALLSQLPSILSVGKLIIRSPCYA
jgi:hypothetical protein